MMTLSSILDLWGKWNLRCSVILSFSLQVFLTLFASFRKKTANHHMYSILWLAYLAADSVAIFAIGLISCGQCNLSTHVAKVDKAVHVFWASFLFLHLGGPDALAAFSLEDSSLWKRHLLIYIFQIGAIISLFVQIFLGDRSLLIPTMMVFLAGNIKLVERTLALYLSSLPKLRQSMMEPMYLPWRRHAYDQLAIELNALNEYSNLAESTVVKHAHLFFQIFKLFIVDLIYISDQREGSREYFSRVSAMDALRLISTELHFFHEMLHTKALAIHSKCSYFFRSIAFTLVTVAFVRFIRSKKHGLSGLDVKITYILLFGGIALDAISLLMLLFSDWTIAKIMPYETMRRDQDGSFVSRLLSSLLSSLLSAMDDMKKPRFAKCKANANTDSTYDVPNTLFIFRRWSETISASNLFSTYFKESPRKMYKCDEGLRSSNILIFPFRMIRKVVSYFHQAGKTIVQSCCTGIRWMIANTEYVSNNPFIYILIFPFRKLVSCFHQAGKTIVQSCCRGIRRLYVSENPFIRNLKRNLIFPLIACFLGILWMTENTKHVSKNPFIYKLWIFIFEEVKRKSVVADDLEKVRGICEARGDLFLESLPREIEDDKFLEYLTDTSYDNSIFAWHIATEIWYNIEGIVVDQTLAEKREFSKILSDYVLYLLLYQPKVMSAVASVVEITTLEILLVIRFHYHMRDGVQNVEQLCKRMIEDESMSGTSPLSMGISLAREMASLGERKWEVMSGVWVEMLSYAAIHIRGETHMQVLSRGGELLAFVWLLMPHFGLFYKAEWGISGEPLSIMSNR